MERSEKPKVIANLNEQFNGAVLAIVSQQSGLSVADVTELRAKLREAGAKHTVAKNTLSRLAAKDTPCANLIEHFTGPTAITVTSGDPVATAKALSDYANSNKKLTIVSGSMNGQSLSSEQIEALAKLPSLDELRGTIVGLLQAPAGKIARLSREPAAQLARVLGAYSRSGS